MKKRITFASDADWRAARADGIGGSEVGTIMGANPWCTPYQLWTRKLAERRGEFSDFVSEDAQRGHDMEQAVVSTWERVTGRKIMKATAGNFMFRDEGHPWRQASPDRVYYVDGKADGILECKTTKRRIEAQNLPLSWVFQLQYYLGISGMKHGSIAWYGFNYEFGHVDMEFSEEVFGLVCKVVDNFWHSCIVGGDEPAAVSVDDVAAMYPASEDGKADDVEYTEYTAWQQYHDLLEQKRRVEDEIEEAKALLLAKCTDAESYKYLGETLWTYKTQSRTTISKEKLIEAGLNPADYSETKESRVFRVKPPKTL